MLAIETKRHIDNARQVLVGKVPDPKQQIDQITNALIYKFMDDMDTQARDAGGQPSFFTGDLESYAWHKLMDPRNGAQEKLNMYEEALKKFSLAEQLPLLFREIYEGARLPYGSPETLNLFLKEIEHFEYSHSEELGNAFEYLLSIMGAQGDAGQFRTPRHIIDFMVQVIDPDFDETILDPACGTAGFLISAYKRILVKHDGLDDVTGQPTLEEAKLSHSEKQKLLGNLTGYDISSDMVKLARVNMYLHGNNQPKIYEYDTLSSEERWDDNFDVILANPPFMSPKGGIIPHKKFGVESTRAEVLFVDYIATHLKLNGRAAIIVPEGIIFQSGKSYKQLRKMLVEDHYLAGVISLPAGVFNPYSGVKTSILWLDKTLAKKKQEILFAKVENDGLSLGTQRRPVEQNDLPQILEALKLWQAGTAIDSLHITTVSKSKLKDSGDYNLSANRYVEIEQTQNQKWPLVALDEVAEVRKGSAITKARTNPDGPIPVVAGGQRPAYYHDKSNRKPDVITISASGAYSGFVNYWTEPIFASDCSTVQPKDETKVSTRYLYEILKFIQDDIYKLQTGGGQPHVYPKDIQKLIIPLPPIEVQQKIVDEIETKQQAIDHARQVIKSIEQERRNFNPLPRAQKENWPIVKLGEISEVTSSKRIMKSDYVKSGVPFYRTKEVAELEAGVRPTTELFISHMQFERISQKFGAPKTNDILVSAVGTIGKVWHVPTGYQDFYFKDGNLLWMRKIKQLVSSEYLSSVLTPLLQSNLATLKAGAAYEALTIVKLKELKIPLPPLETQKQIVAEFAAEQKMAEANKTLIDLYTQKIKSKISEAWGE